MTTPSRWRSAYHAPVLAAEVLELLGDKRHVLDGTLGGGGHSLMLLDRGVTITALDRDPEALAAARARVESAGDALASRFFPIHGNFAATEELDALAGVRFDGILLDLGVSSHQLDEPARGFSFREGEPLDMRMGGETDEGPTAGEWLEVVEERELARVLRDYADEPRGGKLAREIVRRRGTQRFRTSDDLVRAIRSVLGPRSGPGDFARIFQAIRIAVNDELEGLARALPALRDRLQPGGTLAVVSYHSGEDRLVKHAFREWSARCVCPPRQPVCTCRGRALGETLTRHGITATEEEIADNPRARSARLRAWRAAWPSE
jgi:16S rRNA (cytosine1402-N4)-methyltransferase